VTATRGPVPLGKSGADHLSKWSRRRLIGN
jgi:hypothetical protein